MTVFAVAPAALASPAAGELARRILAEGGYQTELPAGQSLPMGLGGAGGLIALLLWAGLAAAVGLLLVWLFGQLGRGAERPAGAGTLDESPEARAGDLADPRRLAEAGRHAEAIHTMLLLAMRGCAARIDPPPPESATSREMLRALPLDRPRRDALAELVREVELSLFGGRPVGPEQYHRCRRSFETLVGESG